MSPPKRGPSWWPIMLIDITKPVASPRLWGSTVSMRKASAEIIAAEETAPLTMRIKSSQIHDGARPVSVPQITSPTIPSMISLFLPYLSDSIPNCVDITAAAREKVLVKSPMEAMVPPRPSTYWGKYERGRPTATDSMSCIDASVRTVPL